MAANESFDVIVVGAGSAGCVVAHRLVTGTDLRVLLVEAGGPDTRPEIHDEQLSSTLSLWGPGELDWGYQTEPQEALYGRTVPVARGKVWGGSSSINAMVHVRGNHRDYDHWAELGNPGWGYQDVLPYFRRSEDFEGGESAYRGAGGPLSVIYHADPTPVSEQLFPAAVEIGMRDRGPKFDYNAEQQVDSPFYYQATKTRQHRRASTAVSYLYPIRQEPNFTLLSNAQVTRLLVEGDRVVGIEYLHDGRTQRARADREVVVCGGAYESPKLLMLSGIGPADVLRTYDVPVVVDLPGVGQNLQDHMIVGVCYLSRHEHPWQPTMIAETGFFTHTRSGEPSPDLQMKFGGLKFVNPPYDREGPGFTFAPVIIQPKSTGYVTLRSSNPLDVAILQPNYLRDPADIASFLAGVRMSRALAATSAMAEFVKVEIAPGPDVTSDVDLVDFIRANASTLWHPVGTCAMGTDRLAVVDADLRVRGVAGLRVADASVMPRIVAGNTNAACVMIGERAADLVRAAR
jgi:choline dehydrogenase